MSAPSEAMMALAFVSRREGHRTMPGSRWGHVLSLELGWMDPGQARAYVTRAEEAGILVPDGDGLRIAVDPQSIEVPRGFRPDPRARIQAAVQAARGPVDDPFLQWVQKVSEKTGARRDKVLAEVAALQERMGGLLHADAAVLWLARDAGLDVKDAARHALEGLKRSSGAKAAATAAPR